MSFRSVLASLAVMLLLASPASATVHVGLIVTLSGPSAGVGTQVRDGFNLAMRRLGGKLGGLDASAQIEDDEGRSDGALARLKALQERQKPDFIVGPLFSDPLTAIIKPATDAGSIVISPRAGPASLAGKSCNANVFVLSYQSEQMIETLGRHAEDAGLKRLLLVAANDAGGRRALESFRHHYVGEPVAEIMVAPDLVDVGPLLERIAAVQPQNVVSLLTGPAGRLLAAEWNRSALGSIAMLHTLVLSDHLLTQAQRDDMERIAGASIWTPNLDTPGNVAFVADFLKEFGYTPGLPAFEGFEAAMLIDGAVRTAGGVADRAALRTAVKQAAFTSLRGAFSFGNNNFPVQDFYVVRLERRFDGGMEPRVVRRVFSQFGDAYASECPLK